MSKSKKKLPKAIRRTADSPATAAGAGARQAHQGEPRAEDAAAAAAGRESDVIELAATSQGSIADASAQTALTLTEIDAVRRRSLAQSIVERHATYSAVGGIIPLPIVNVASITAIIVRMVKQLTELYGVPFERDRTRTIVLGLVGGAMPTGLAAVTTSTLAYVVPGSGLIGLAVSSMGAVACTRGIGLIFVAHFERGATLHDFP
jgi:uncharacterized protein (DUF697 family)